MTDEATLNELWWHFVKLGNAATASELFMYGKERGIKVGPTPPPPALPDDEEEELPEHGIRFTKIVDRKPEEERKTLSADEMMGTGAYDPEPYPASLGGEKHIIVAMRDAGVPLEIRQRVVEHISVLADRIAELEKSVMVMAERNAELRKALKDCQTLTPSLMDEERAIARLQEINRFVYSLVRK